MALRQIRLVGDDILRKKSRQVKDINESIIILLDDMFETLKDIGGAGLAAPQVGILRQVVIIHMDDELIELINPEIILEKGEQFEAEGCLSVPDESGYVKRPYKVKVKALNRNGEEKIYEAEDYLATAFCHEIDHLSGILYVDKDSYISTAEYEQKENKTNVDKIEE